MRCFKNILLISFVLFLALAALATTASAAFLIIDEHGNLVWQVLSKGSDGDSDEDKSGSSGSNGSGRSGTDGEEKREFRVEVRTEEEGLGRPTRTEVKIKTEDGRVKLRVGTPSGETEMDVTELKGDIIRVRERTEEGEIRIRARAGRLEIKQKGVGALTHFPVSVNPQTNELTITTPAGTRVVTVLPAVAVQNILTANIMDRILAPEEEATEAAELVEGEEENEVEFTGIIESIGETWVVGGRTVIVGPQTRLDEGLLLGVLAEVEGSLQPEGTILAEEIETREEVSVVEEDGQVAFKVRGVKNVRFLNLFSLDAPIQALVSAQTGETLQVSRPWFLTLFGFLFSQ